MPGKSEDQKQLIDLVAGTIAKLEGKLAELKQKYGDMTKTEAQGTAAGSGEKTKVAQVDPAAIVEMEKEIKLLEQDIVVVKDFKNECEEELKKIESKEQREQIEYVMRCAVVVGIVAERREEELEARNSYLESIKHKPAPQKVSVVKVPFLDKVTEKMADNMFKNQKFRYIKREEVDQILKNEDFKRKAKEDPNWIKHDESKLKAEYENMIMLLLTRMDVPVGKSFEENEKKFRDKMKEPSGYEKSLTFIDNFMMDHLKKKNPKKDNSKDPSKDPSKEATNDAEKDGVTDITKEAANVPAGQNKKDVKKPVKRETKNGFTPEDMLDLPLGDKKYRERFANVLREILDISAEVRDNLNQFVKGEANFKKGNNFTAKLVEREAVVYKEIEDLVKELTEITLEISKVNDIKKMEKYMPLYVLAMQMQTNVQYQLGYDTVFNDNREFRRQNEMWSVYENLNKGKENAVRIVQQAEEDLYNANEKPNRLKKIGNNSGGIFKDIMDWSSDDLGELLTRLKDKKPMNSKAIKWAKELLAEIVLAQILNYENRTAQIRDKKIFGDSFKRERNKDHFVKLSKVLAETPEFEKEITKYLTKDNFRERLIKFLAEDVDRTVSTDLFDVFYKKFQKATVDALNAEPKEKKVQRPKSVHNAPTPAPKNNNTNQPTNDQPAPKKTTTPQMKPKNRQ